MTQYTDWTHAQLVAELRARDVAAAAPERIDDSINLLETIHLAQTDYLTVDSSSNIFNQMLDNFLAVTGCEYGFIDELFRTDDGGMYLEARAITDIAWDDASRALYKKLVSGEIAFDNMNSLYGEVLKTGKPFMTNSAPTDPRRTGVPPGHPALNSFLGIPLVAAGEFVGMLGMANAPGGFDERMLEHLSPLTRICAIVMLSLKIDRRRAEAIASLEASAAELKATNLELQRFAYVCSHDLQAPIRHVAAYTEMLVNGLGADAAPETRRVAKKIVAGSVRMGRLVEDLLSYARSGEPSSDPELITLGPLVQGVVDTLRIALESSGGSVECADLPALIGHRTLITQLFQNLIQNALSHRRDGVAPRIEVQCDVSTAPPTFVVKDNGPGIDSAYHERVFEIFQRLAPHAEDGGTGIGLAICRRVVESHGGRIWIAPNAGGGAAFHFTLAEEPAMESS